MLIYYRAYDQIKKLIVSDVALTTAYLLEESREDAV